MNDSLDKDGMMSWERLITDKRLGMEQYHDRGKHIRSDFQRDYDRLIFSSPFRRLQNKTQVFPLPGSIFVHNRLTHSLEVSSVGRSMATEAVLRLMERHGSKPWAGNLLNVPDIVAAACLCHDLGNPPFGHNGEKTISTFFSEGEGQKVKGMVSNEQWQDLVNFEGNANSFRLLTHQFEGRRPGGFAMTYSTLAAVVKYPYGSGHSGASGKFGYFQSEKDIFGKVARELGIPETEPGKFARHPLVWLVEAADDICYQIMDLEDAHRLKILPTSEVVDLMLGFFSDNEKDKRVATMRRLEDPNEQIGYLRSKAIGEMVEECGRLFADHENEILSGHAEGSLTTWMTPRLREAYARCSATAWEKIYRAPQVVDVEISGNRILTSLLSALTDAAMNPEKNFSQLLFEKVPRQYNMRGEKFFDRLQGALDHISGMTDVYALDLYRSLNGLTLPAV